ncbi:MAG: alpha/beta fold hydrolase [Steroidobacteraceae bacterium]
MTTPLVLLHGFAFNRCVFDSLCAELTPTRTCLALDLPGHGGRNGDALPRSIHALQGDLQEYLPPQCDLLGWSLGGQAALALAASCPERVRRLVLVTTTPRFIAGDDWAWGMASEVFADFRRRMQCDPEATVRDFLDLSLRGSRAASAQRAELTRALREGGQPGAETLAGGLDLLARTDLAALCPRIATPALIISGEYDRITPSAASRWLAQNLGSARHLELARAAHCPFLSHGREFLGALEAFLGERDLAA